MMDTEAEPALLPTLRRLRGLIAAPSNEMAEADAPSEWRDDLRLFLTAWAAGFLFFMVLIA
jgi:hypothetical protein